jgi:hypothetical protein
LVIFFHPIPTQYDNLPVVVGMERHAQPYADGHAQGSAGPVVPVDTHAREDAVRILSKGGMSSVKSAFYLTGGVLAAAAAVGGILAALGEKSQLSSVLGALGALPLVWFICWIVCDWIRLHEHACALQRVLDTEKQYELLIDDARRERDQVKVDRDRLSAQIATLTAAVDLVRAIAPRQPPENTE